MARTEEDYKKKNKILKELGIKPLYNSLKEERKAKREIKDLLQELK